MLDFGFYNLDCMEGMKEFPDNYFELAIVDPPYEIGADKESMRSGTRTSNKELYKNKKWDVKPPKEYFDALIRISENQIIWGGNYFCNLLPVSRGWIYWHKFVLTENYSQGELAWSSFDCVLKYFGFRYQGNYVGNTVQTASFIEKRIHPTQKPVALYLWLLHNYAKQGDKILDTHTGSASLPIACEIEGFDYVAFETDQDYFRDATKRLKQARITTIDMFKEPKKSNGVRENEELMFLSK